MFKFYVNFFCAVSRCVLRCTTSSVYCLLHPEEASLRNVDVIKGKDFFVLVLN